LNDEQHDHDDHEHSHSTEPLTGVDAAELHAAVEQLSAALHGYVDTAVGVRAEFGAHEADEDPRVLSLEGDIGALNARLYDLLHDQLGMHADLTGMSWGDEEETDADAPPVPDAVDTFHLGFVVGPQAAASDMSLDSVLDLIDSGGADIAQHLVDAGFTVSEWGVSRGAPVMFEEDEDDEDGGS
jgi:hypothetical protein